VARRACQATADSTRNLQEVEGAFRVDEAEAEAVAAHEGPPCDALPRQKHRLPLQLQLRGGIDGDKS